LNKCNGWNLKAVNRVVVFFRPLGFRERFGAGKTISEAEIRTLIATAQEAPSWANTQASRYYVALSKEKADAVREVIGEWNKKNTEGAPVFIVSTYVKNKSGFRNDGEPANEIGNGWGAYDNGLSDAHLILKARAMGFNAARGKADETDKSPYTFPRNTVSIPRDRAISRARTRVAFGVGPGEVIL